MLSLQESDVQTQVLQVSVPSLTDECRGKQDVGDLSLHPIINVMKGQD